MVDDLIGGILGDEEGEEEEKAMTFDEIRQEVKDILLKNYSNLNDKIENRNRLQKIYKCLIRNNYIYYRNRKDNILENGAYVKYIDMREKEDLKLKNGGFVVSDEEGILGIFFRNRKWKICKENYLIFKKLSKNDMLKITFFEKLRCENNI
tara:strand:+ start:1878 stop:2330 length:453 start_codon:yes stop_codon:yes gene_type:complete